MSNLALATVWPAEVPLPYFEWSGRPRNAKLESKADIEKIHRRARFLKNFQEGVCAWVLTPVQYYAFQAFYNDVLGGGVAQFRIGLRYPFNSELTDWAVRFAGDGFQSRYIEGMWQVSAQIELMNRYVIDDPAALEDSSHYLAFPGPGDDTDAGGQRYITADGFVYSAKA